MSQYSSNSALTKCLGSISPIPVVSVPSQLLAGTVEVLAPSEGNVLEGDEGAFVNVAAICLDEPTFKRLIETTMSELGLKVRAISDIEPAAVRLERKEPTAAFFSLLETARRHPGNLAVSAFYSFPAEDEGEDAGFDS